MSLGTVMAVDPSDPGDYRFDPPVVQGLSMPTCVRFSPDGDSMFVCSMPTGSVWRLSDFA
jgi:sugar lactone lactonase YvrE